MKYADIMENNLINPRSALDRVIFSEYGLLPTDVSGTYKANEFLGQQFKQIIDASGESAYDRGVQLQMATLVKDTLGYGFDQALAMVEGGDWTGELTDRVTKKPSASQAMGHALRGTYYSDYAGRQFSKYMVTGDARYLKLYEDYTEKARQDRVGTDDWGFLSNLAVKSASTVGSSARSTVGSLGIRWGATGLGWLLGGPAGAAVGNNIGRLISNAFVLIDSGMSQAGNDFAELYHASDANGKRLDLDSPMARLGFYGDLLVNGAIEVVGLEFIPAYKNLLKTLGPDALSTAFKFTWRDAIRKFGVDEIESIFGEGSEEFMQGIVSDSIKNAIFAHENNTGKKFDLKPFGNIISDASKAFAEAAQGMVVYGALSNGLSLGVGSVIGQTRMSQQANKNQNEQDASVVIDRRIILTPRTGRAQEKTDGEKKLDTDKKLGVVNVIRTKKGAVPASHEDAQTIADLDVRGASVVRVNPVDATVADENTAASSKDNLAYMFGLQRDAESGKYVIASTWELDDLERSVKSLRGILDVTRNDDALEFSYMTNDSRKVDMAVSVQREGMVLEDIDADLDEVSVPYYGALMSQDQYDEHALRKELTDRIMESTEGNISRKTLRAGVDSMIVASRALGINEDEFLDKRVQVRFSTDEESLSVSGGRKVNGYMVPQTGKNGDTVFSINLTSNADASTLVHEVGHVLRAMATDDQLAAFSQAYGWNTSGMWLSDISEQDGKFSLGDMTFDTREEAEKIATANEERFADDFVVYLKTGNAPNAEMQGLFARMKEFLKNVYNALKDRLSPEVRKAFDDLLNSGISRQGTETDTLFQTSEALQQYDKVEARYRDTDIWLKAPNGNPTNLSERQWVQVRTPAFKEWFGDWEAVSAVDWVLSANPVAESAKLMFQKDGSGSLIDRVLAYWGNRTTVSHPELGVVVLDKEGVKSSIGHGIGKEKASGFALVPRVIEAGRIISRETNWKNRGYDTAVIAAPIRMGGVTYVAEVVVIQRPSSNKFYLHEVEIKERLEGAFKTPTEGSAPRTSRLIISKLLAEGKLDSSIAVDENGEPEIFYHGSYTDNIETFELQADEGYYGRSNRGGFSFTNKKERAEGYAKPRKKKEIAMQKWLSAVDSAIFESGISEGDGNEASKKFFDILKDSEDDVIQMLGEEEFLPDFRLVYFASEESRPFSDEIKMWTSQIPNLIKAEMPELAKRLMDTKSLYKDIKGETTPRVYEVFLNVPQGSEQHDLTPDTLYKLGQYFDVNKTDTKATVVNMPEGEKVVYVGQSSQIKSATDNVGTFDDGNPSILFQDQTRTPEFKAWFGDWEKNANFNWLMSADPLVSLTGEEFKENLVDNVSAFYGKMGNRVVRDGLGTVTLTRHDVQSSVAHGIGRVKAAAFAAVPDVIQQGREFNRTENYKGRGYTSITIAAPIAIRGEEYICEVVINRREKSNNFYLHEVEIKEKLQFGNQVRNYMDENHPNRNTKTGASRLIISKLLTEGKFESSKVVDKDGRPLVVYHATDESFDTFDLSRLGMITDANALDGRASVLARLGIWASREPVNRKTFQALSMPLYVNIRNPYRTTFDDLWDRAGDSDADVLRTELQDEGYDGIILDDSEFDTESYVVFSNTQIKSAIDNTGSFDPGNPNILYQLAQDGDVDSIVDFFRKSDIIIDKDEIVIYDGKIAVKDDPGQEYDVESLRKLHNSVSEQLWLFNPDSDGLFGETDLRGIPSKGEEAHGAGVSRDTDRKRVAVRSTLPDDFIPKKGWTGYERTPTRIEDAWDKFGFVSFIGAQVDSITDLVQMYSIYRNPNLEYFHIVLLKDGRIVRQTSISSGVSGMSFVVPSSGISAIDKILNETEHDSVYILHNHPSGNPEPSNQDYGVTGSFYNKAKEKLKGHIVLDHTQYALMTVIDKKHVVADFHDTPEGYHQIETRKTFSDSISNPGQVADLFVANRKTGTSLIALDNKNRMVDIFPFSTTMAISDIEAMYKERSYRGAFLMFDSSQEFDDFFHANAHKELPFLDIILVSSNERRGYRSAREEDIFTYKDYQNGLPRPADWLWNETTADNTLFQLSDNKRQEYLDSRRREVKEAIEAHFYVGDAILSEYAGEDWADKEIRFRQNGNFFGAFDDARQYDDRDEYIKAMEKESGDQWTEESEEWYIRVFDYSRIRTPDQSDRIFLQQWASSEKNLLALAQRLKGYSFVQTQNGKQSVSYRFGSFKDVDRKVSALTTSSSDEQIREAMDIVYNNPRPYRKALMVVEQADASVQEFRGLAASGEASRDAYYDALGETMEDELTKFDQAERSATETRQVKLDDRQLRASFEEQERRLLEANAELKSLNVKTSENLKASQAQVSSYEKKIASLEKDRSSKVVHLKELSEQIRNDAKRYASMKHDLSVSKRMIANRDGKIDDLNQQAIADRRELGKRDTEIKQLEQSVSEAKSRYKSLRDELNKANNEIHRLTVIKDALRRRLWALAIRTEKDRLLKQIKKKATFNESTMDASYQEAFQFVASLFDKKRGRSIVAMPETLDRYMPEEYLGMIQRDNRIGRWTVEELETLSDAVSLMKTDALLMKQRRDAERASRLQSIAINVFKNQYGRMPDIDVRALNATGIMNDITYDVDASEQKYVNGKESRFDRAKHMFNQSYVHIQRLARWLDGYKEGPLYDFFVREMAANWEGEFRETQRRTEALDTARSEMEVSPDYLSETITKYKVNGTTELELTREQAIGVYIYNQNAKGRMKLLGHAGNGMNEFDIASIVDALSDKDRAIGDYLIESIGGDAEYERQREAVYEAYNKILGREERYFPLRAEGIETEGSSDLITGPHRNSVSYVEKGMTIDRVDATYPLDLNVFNTWLVALKTQEHLIAFAKWVKDAQYLMGPHGAVGHAIKVNYGQTSYDTLEGFVNRIAGQAEKIHDLEKLFNPIVSRVAASKYSGSLSSAMKQLSSLSAGVRGDMDPLILIRVLLGRSPAQEVNGWKQARQIMFEKDPAMKNRTFNLEVSRFRDLEHSTKAGRAVAKITDRGIDLTSGLVDSEVTVRMWWGVYRTQLAKGASEAEAVFRAGQFVGETQSSSNPMDQSSVQASKHTFLRALALFKNDSFQHWNQAFWDVPYYAKNKMWAKAGGTLVSLTLGTLMLLSLGGALLSRKGEDDEDKKKRLWRSIIAQVIEDHVPFAGDDIVAGLRGFGGDGMVTFTSDLGRLTGELTDFDEDREALAARLWDLIEDGVSVSGLPTLAISRTVRAFDEKNWWRVLGGYWYRMGDDQ